MKFNCQIFCTLGIVFLRWNFKQKRWNIIYNHILLKILHLIGETQDWQNLE